MKHKILVIDDQVSICLILENFLSANYDVVIKNDGLQAIEWLEGNIPDLIISDVQMPIMDGYQFLEKVRQPGDNKNTPVIMLSAGEAGKERMKCYRLGAQGFLTKPFNLKELEELIRKNLSRTYRCF